MNKALRLTLTLAAFGAAVASQAAFLAYNGSGVYTGGSVNLTSVQNTGDDFGFTTGVANFSPITAASGTITLGSLTGDSITITYSGTAAVGPVSTAVSAIGTITGATGIYTGYVSANNTVTVTTNTRTSGSKLINFTNVIGDVEAVPEPTSIAALGLGAVALLRRRNKKA